MATDSREAPFIAAPVDVYWNIHRRVYSVRSRRSGRIIEHMQALTLQGPIRLVVNPGGLAAVLASGRKNVHAFLRSDSYRPGASCADGLRGLTYNPRREGAWVWSDNRAPIGRDLSSVVCTIKDGLPVVKGF